MRPPLLPLLLLLLTSLTCRGRLLSAAPKKKGAAAGSAEQGANYKETSLKSKDGKSSPFIGLPGSPTTRCACCQCKKSHSNTVPRALQDAHMDKTLVPVGASNADHQCHAVPCAKNPGKYCWVTSRPVGPAASSAVWCDALDPPFDETKDCDYGHCSTHHLTDKCACCSCNKRGAGGGHHTCNVLPCRGQAAVDMSTGGKVTPFCWSPFQEEGGKSCQEVLSEDAAFQDCRNCADEGNLPDGKDSEVSDAEMEALRKGCDITAEGCGGSEAGSETAMGALGGRDKTEDHAFSQASAKGTREGPSLRR